MESLRDREIFKQFKLLQFGDDQIVAKGWFRETEVTPVGQPGSLDPMSIPRPDGAYDCIVSSHVITRVVDHKKAVSELTRVLSPQGLIFLSYPLPGLRATTSDWGFPDPKQNGNFRILGDDFEPELVKLTQGAHVAAIRALDKVTNDDEIVYVITKGFTWLRRLMATTADMRLLE